MTVVEGGANFTFMNAATKTPTAKKLVRQFAAAGFSACEMEWMDGKGVQVWTLDETRANALRDLVSATGLVWEPSGSRGWTIKLKQYGMMIPPQHRPFC